jgi:hypothetical protein
MTRLSLPDLTRPKNEVVFYLAFASGAFVTLVELLEGFDTSQATSYTGAGIVLLGLAQRLHAYGRETVEDLKRERDEALG